MGASKTVYESVKLLVSFLFDDNPEKELKDCPFVFSFLDFTKKRLFFFFLLQFDGSYKGFDEYEGIEVAWNQVKLNNFLRSTENLERLYCEIHLLKTLKHKNIMKFYTSWVDTSKKKINFITELFTSGTLRQ